MEKSKQNKPFSIKLADGREYDFDNGYKMSELYERMRPRKKKTPKVNLKEESKTIKQDGVTQVFTMEERENGPIESTKNNDGQS